MPGIASLIAELILAEILDERISLRRNEKTEWVLILLSVFLGVAGLFLSILALERFFEARYMADTAALATGTVSIIAAFGAVMTAQALRRQKTAARRAQQKDLAAKVHNLVTGILKDIDTPVRENPGTALLVAALAGFCAVRNHATP
jgi:hypothetical protein